MRKSAKVLYCFGTLKMFYELINHESMIYNHKQRMFLRGWITLSNLFRIVCEIFSEKDRKHSAKFIKFVHCLTCYPHLFSGDCNKTKNNWQWFDMEFKVFIILPLPGPVLIISDSRIKAKSVVVKWTVPSSATGMFIRTSFWKIKLNIMPSIWLGGCEA